MGSLYGRRGQWPLRLDWSRLKFPARHRHRMSNIRCWLPWTEVFDNPLLAEEAALRVFAVWAQALPMAPAELSRCTIPRTACLRRIGRLVTEVAKRQKPPGARCPIAGQSELRHRQSPSRLSTHGRSCQRNCGGAAFTLHPVVAALALARALAATAMAPPLLVAYLQRCRQGVRPCSQWFIPTPELQGVPWQRQPQCTNCVKGKVTCSNCTGAGRVERWIEIEETVRHDV